MNNYYVLKITGKNPNYFLKELIKKNIKIYNLKTSFKEIIITIDSQDYEKIKSLKTSYKITIVNRLGFHKYLYLLKENIVFITFFFLAILFIVFLSNVIFNVEIKHSNKDILELVNNDLKYYGIKKYQLKKSYAKKEQIAKEILKKETDNLEWLEIEEVGTKYIVQVEQRKKSKISPQCIAQNVIAKKDARILQIVANSGEVLVKKDDYVSKGAILISGLIYNKETIVAKRCAQGKVYGEVWYRVLVSLPKTYKEEKLTGQKNYGIEINFFNHNINLFSNYKTAKKQRYFLINNKLLPFSISFTKFKETKLNIKKYTLNNVLDDALKIAEEKLLTQLHQDDTILSKKVLKKEQNNSKINVEVFLKVKENITSYQDISNLDIEKLNEKEQKE